jgi:hypothetical protein
MAAKKKTKKGKRLTSTGKYDIKPKKGKARGFTGTLLETFNFGAKRIAIFSVPKKK